MVFDKRMVKGIISMGSELELTLKQATFCKLALARGSLYRPVNYSFAVSQSSFIRAHCEPRIDIVRSR